MEQQGTTKRSTFIITRAQGPRLSQENIEQALEILKRCTGKPHFATSPAKNTLFSTQQILKEGTDNTARLHRGITDG